MNDEITLNFEGRGDETIRITARPSMMHPEQCAFEVSVPLFPNNSAHFANRESAQGSPLVEQLSGLLQGDTSRIYVLRNFNPSSAMLNIWSCSSFANLKLVLLELLD